MLFAATDMCRSDAGSGCGAHESTVRLGSRRGKRPPRRWRPVAAWIRPILITGDHPGTAAAVAVDLGILPSDEAVIDARGASDAELGSAAVFARATPDRKLDIIHTLQAEGQIVSMTGDGVNDGPALRRADIGVAFRHSGTLPSGWIACCIRDRSAEQAPVGAESGPAAGEGQDLVDAAARGRRRIRLVRRRATDADQDLRVVVMRE